MLPQGRLGDKSSADKDVHGCSKCPHQVTGPAIQGSQDVLVNSRPALRVDDMGVHAVCCGTNTWTAVEGSDSVFINGKPAYRMGDKSEHCGGVGKLVEGSPNVLLGKNRGEQHDCDSDKLLSDAAKSGSPFVEAPTAASDNVIQTVKDMAMNQVSKAIDKAVNKVTCFIAKELGCEKAVEAINGVAGFVMNGGLSGGAKAVEIAVTGATSFAVKEYVGAKNQRDGMPDSNPPVTVNAEKPVYDDKSLYYGNENAKTTIGRI